MLHPFEMFGGTYILTEWRAFGSAFLFCEFTPLYGLNPLKIIPKRWLEPFWSDFGVLAGSEKRTKMMPQAFLV